MPIFSAVELERLEAEKQQIHSEYEQERIAYQKLLKEYNRLELLRDNLQVPIDRYFVFITLV